VDFKDSRNEYEIKTNTYQQSIIMIKSLLIFVLLTLIACNATKPVIVTKPPLKPKPEVVSAIKKPCRASSKEITTVVKPVKKRATTRETEVIVSTSKTVVTNDVIVSYISNLKKLQWLK
jgi:hypothetical protein